MKVAKKALSGGRDDGIADMAGDWGPSERRLIEVMDAQDESALSPGCCEWISKS